MFSGERRQIFRPGRKLHISGRRLSLTILVQDDFGQDVAVPLHRKRKRIVLLFCERLSVDRHRKRPDRVFVSEIFVGIAAVLIVEHQRQRRSETVIDDVQRAVRRGNERTVRRGVHRIVDIADGCVLQDTAGISELQRRIAVRSLYDLKRDPVGGIYRNIDRRPLFVRQRLPLVGKRDVEPAVRLHSGQVKLQRIGQRKDIFQRLDDDGKRAVDRDILQIIGAERERVASLAELDPVRSDLVLRTVLVDHDLGIGHIQPRRINLFAILVVPLRVRQITIHIICARHDGRAVVFIAVLIPEVDGKLKTGTIVDDILFRVDPDLVIAFQEVAPGLRQEGHDLPVHLPDLDVRRVRIERRFIDIIFRDGSGHAARRCAFDRIHVDRFALGEHDDLADGEGQFKLSVDDGLIGRTLEDALTDLCHAREDLALAVGAARFRLIDRDVPRRRRHDRTLPDRKIDDADAVFPAIGEERIEVFAVLVVVEGISVRDDDQPFFRISGLLFQIGIPADDGGIGRESRICDLIVDGIDVLLLVRFPSVD